MIPVACTLMWFHYFHVVKSPFCWLKLMGELRQKPVANITNPYVIPLARVYKMFMVIYLSVINGILPTVHTLR